MHVAEVTYVSRVKVEPVEGKIRRAQIPGKEEPVLFGVHSEVAEHYGISPDAEDPHPSTLDYLVAAAGGWLLGTFAGALAACHVSFDKDSLYADTVGEIEVESKVLVVKRKIAWFPNHKTQGAQVQRVTGAERRAKPAPGDGGSGLGLQINNGWPP
jgi:hypothetical protein